MRQRKASQEGLFDCCRAIAELATPGPPSEKAVGTTGMPFRGSARSHPEYIRFRCPCRLALPVIDVRASLCSGSPQRMKRTSPNKEPLQLA